MNAHAPAPEPLRRCVCGGAPLVEREERFVTDDVERPQSRVRCSACDRATHWHPAQFVALAAWRNGLEASA